MSDMISRDRVIALLGLDHNDYVYIDKRELAKRIEKLKGIDIVRCKDCVAYIDGTCDCDSIYAHMSGDLIGVHFEPCEDFYCGYGYAEGSE